MSDLDRSVSFYQDVMSIEELRRDDQVAALGSKATGSPMIYLIQVSANAVRRGGQESLGLRTFSCNVGSLAELDHVQDRLETFGAFRDRQVFSEASQVQMVRGYDPDRLPVNFVVYQTGNPIGPDDYLRAASLMYSVDV